MTSSTWCECPLIFKDCSTTLVIVKSSQPCFLVLIGKNDHQITIEYPLHKGWCLKTNLFLPLVCSPILLPHLHLTPLHLTSPPKKNLINYIWDLFYYASYSTGEHTSKPHKSLSQNWNFGVILDHYYPLNYLQGNQKEFWV